MTKKYEKPSDLTAEVQHLLDYRLDWETEWKRITRYILPAHGIYALYTKPQKRHMVPDRAVNMAATEALDVFVSLLETGITPETRPWFKLRFNDPMLEDIPELRIWLDECESRLYAALAASNFYSAMNTYYTEYAGFGNAVCYIGEEAEPFVFHPLSTGEYVFALGGDGTVNKLYRTILLTYRQVEEFFGRSSMNRAQKAQHDANPETYTHVWHGVLPIEYQDKPFKSFYFDVTTTGDTLKPAEQFLDVSGFYEFPFFVSRGTVSGGDVYGTGRGNYALPDAMRLQEMEKALLLASHKTANPPLNAPVEMKGNVKTLPGGVNFFSNPQNVVSSAYQVRIDYSGLEASIGRTEQRIKDIFYNNLMLTASRDPNLSPLKAAEVHQRDEEKMSRISSLTGRILQEGMYPMLNRGFNILERKGQLPQVPPGFEQAVLSGIAIKFISVLAQSQKMFSLQPIQTFMNASAGVIQYYPEARDKVNGDALIDEIADITGVTQKILPTDDEVRRVREERARQIAEQQQREQQQVDQATDLAAQEQQANTAKTYSEAGVNLNEMTMQ